MGYGKRKRWSTVYGPRKQPRYITEQDLTVEDTRMTGDRAVRIRDEVHGIVYIVDADADPDLDGVSMADRIRRLVILPDEGNPIPRAAPLTLLGTAAVRHMRGLPTALDPERDDRVRAGAPDDVPAAAGARRAPRGRHVV